jgi:hypothetical protein
MVDAHLCHRCRIESLIVSVMVVKHVASNRTSVHLASACTPICLNLALEHAQTAALSLPRAAPEVSFVFL